jgi:hypothetical protein
MKLIITILILSLHIVTISSAKIEPEKIIPQFYHILAQAQEASEADELEFFGGDECGYIRTLVLAIPKYSSSKTPIWDYLRNHKDFFSTRGLKNNDKPRIQYTPPVRITRLWNGHIDEQLTIFTSFPTAIIDNKKGSSGYTTIRFALGRACYIDIGATSISRLDKTFFELLYKDSKNE